MNKNIFAFILFLIFSFQAQAQETNDNETRLKNGEDLKMLYRNEKSVGLFVHSAGGFGLSYRRGKQVNVNRKRMFELEAQNYKHPKEIKSVNTYFENSKGFIYGKLNSFLMIRPGFGYQNILYQKSDKKSVEIRYSYFIGATLAFAKPVYLEIKRGDIISTERYTPGVDSIDIIYGKASFFTGIEHTKIYPGGYAKLALSFEYADKYNKVKAVEVGAIVDVYVKGLPMMAYNKDEQVLISLYLKLIWGKKWF